MTQRLSVILPDGTVERPELGSGDRSRRSPWSFKTPWTLSASVLPLTAFRGELARQALAICRAEVQSVQTGKAVAVA